MTRPSGGQAMLQCNRRDFLGAAGGLAIAGLALPQWVSARAREDKSAAPLKGARSCILVYLLGGPPHLDMWDLKPGAPAEVRGPFRPIATRVPGLQICEHLPHMAELAPQYAIVRSVSHNNHNHTPMIYYTLTGRPVEAPNQDNDVRPPQRSDAPHLGAVLASFKSSSTALPGYIALPELAVRSSLQGQYKRARERLRGGGAGFLGPMFDPLTINGEPGTREAIPALALAPEISGERLEHRAVLLSLLDRGGARPPSEQTLRSLQYQAIVLTGAANGGKAPVFSLDGEPGKLRDRYGRHRFGSALLLARRLAEAGVPMVAVHFNEMTLCDGWDLHAKNFVALKEELLPMLDRSLSALLNDLNQRGLLEQTLVLIMGEFGRTPRINKDAGRDHWGLCSSTVLAGGGIRGGQIYGGSDKIGAYPAADPVDPVDIHATMHYCMGLDPMTTITDQLGRPQQISTGKVITRLL